MFVMIDNQVNQFFYSLNVNKDKVFDFNVNQELYSY